MMLIMVTSPIKSFFMRSLDLLAASKSDWQLIGCPIAFTTGSLHARTDISRNGTLWEYRLDSGSGSVRLDVEGPDDVAPFLRFVGDELAKVGGRDDKRRASKVGKPCLHLGIGEARVDLLVELVDDLHRRVLGYADAIPCARLVARHELTHSRDVRQRVRARGGGYRERPQPASPDI